MDLSRKTIAISCAVLILLIGIWIIYAQRATTIANLDSQGTSIVAFGDSLVHGYGSSPGHDFPSLLSVRIGQPIVNMGVNGDTTASAHARLDGVLSENPKIVIVLLGGNDFLQRVPADETFSNLAAIIDAIQAHGSAVLLLGVRGGLITDAYASRFASFAKEHHAAFVPNVLDGLLGHSEFMYDEVHPNDAGYAKIADKVEPVLNEMLK